MELLYKDTTIVLSSTFVILAPGDVRPGHMMLAPLRTNFIAPLSTCMWGNIKGSESEKNTVLLTLKAPAIICSRRQFKILPLFQK